MANSVFKQNNNNYAIAYYRFSSHSQNEASIDQQREQAQLYAETHDLNVIKEYTDRAISGTTDERPGFQQMLAEVSKLKPAVLMECMLESMAEFYSKQLRQNVVRGMRYNAENALYNGHKTLGYRVDDTKHYIKNEDTAPFVQYIFKQYADGKPLTEIADELNAQGVRIV